MALTILVIGLFIFAAYLFKGIFDRTGVPDVLLLMLCGIALGPVAGVVSAADFGNAGSALASMALVIILFESGIDLDLASLRPSMAATLKITLATFLVTWGIAAGVGHLMAHLSLQASLMLGVILAGTSSAVVIPLVKSLNVEGRARTILVLESAITDVLCIVGIFAMIEAVKSGGTSIGSVVASVLETLLVAAFIGALAGLGWLFLLRAARQLPHGSFASAAACFIIYGVTELAGFSGAICVLCFGLVLANGRQFAKVTHLIRPGRLAAFSSSEQEFLHQLIFVLKTFFFVYLGISMQLKDPGMFVYGGIIVLLVYLARHLAALFLLDTDLPHEHAKLAAVMVPKGLAAAVLAGLPLQAGIPGGETIKGIVYVVVLLSIALTAVLIPMQRVAPTKGLYRALFARFRQPD
jgi:NhaP-type Na+/H+ or K+/H+ antiporter